jgi:hypothetical protein
MSLSERNGYMDMLLAAALLRLSDVTNTWRRPPLAGCASPVNTSPSRQPHKNRTYQDHPKISTTTLVIGKSIF